MQMFAHCDQTKPTIGPVLVYRSFRCLFFFVNNTFAFDVVLFLYQVLSDLSRKGVAALNEAHEYFHRCWTASLMPKNFDFSRAQEKTASGQEVVLYDRVAVVVCCFVLLYRVLLFVACCLSNFVAFFCLLLSWLSFVFLFY